MSKQVRVETDSRERTRLGWMFLLGMMGMLLVGVLPSARAAEVAPWCFSDSDYVMTACPPGPQSVLVQCFPARGSVIEERRAVTVDADGTLSIRPLGAGIHVVTLASPQTDDRSERFIALAPPPLASDARIREAMPNCAERLLAGEPLTIVAFGDSVTATGEFHHFFAAMLARATGNTQITVRVAAHPGCSIDATLRNLDVETADGVDLALLMYGLNDQGAGVPLAAYREQVAALVTAMKTRHADIVLLQPTPHIEMPKEPPTDETDPAWAFVMRVRGYAAALDDLGLAMSVPVAATFDALWGDGAASLPAVYTALRPCYPPHYSKSLEVMAESGDTIHPNANGHAALARALYRCVAAPVRAMASALDGQGVTRWTAEGPVTEVSLTNRSPEQRRGEVTLFAPSDAIITGERQAAYDLAPGASVTLRVRWSDVTTAADLRRHPVDRYLVPGQCWLYVVDQQASSNHVIPIRAVREPAVEIAVERQVVPAGGKAVVRWLDHETVYRSEQIAAPQDASARNLIQIDVDGSPVVGEVAWTRYASAQVGETIIDGAVDEWEQAVWSPLGLPVQARWTSGPSDKRASPAECSLLWSARCGQEALSIAMRITGDVTKDRFTLWFDPRATEALGTPGGYFWVDGRCVDDGRLELRAGETTRGSRDGLAGVWQNTADGRNIELQIPYAVLGLSTWPTDGDLGCSLLWAHQGEGGTTMLQWSEDRHPWNPRWFGVIRRQEHPDVATLPWMVRTR